MPRTVLITGASGLLGRAVAAAFADAGWDVVGTALTRAGPGLLRLDQCDAAAVDAALARLRPDVVVNSAAERRPDNCERDAAASAQLNVDSVWTLAKAAARVGAAFIQVSTDYLWDGGKAPYAEDDACAPPNEYGRQKLRGEWAARAAHPGAVVLRLPVLYGPTDDLAESAVTAFADVVLRGAPATVDDWQIRVPTYTPDIGVTLARMGDALVSAPPRLPAGVYHYSSDDRVTRYGLVVLCGRLLGRPVDHVTRNPGAPPGAPRPYDCHLATAKLRATGLAAPTTPLEAGLCAVLRVAPRPGEN